MRHVVCYDIPDDRRRNRVADILLDYGTRVQESVFECILEKPLADELAAKLERALVPLEDKIVMLPLCATCDLSVRRWGLSHGADDAEVYIL